jgi:hypothetical protein
VGRWEGGPAADGGALQASLFELRPDKSLEVGGEKNVKIEKNLVNPVQKSPATGG